METASKIWRGVMRFFLLSRAALPANSIISAEMKLTQLLPSEDADMSQQEN
jgi:hypothetical protein